MIRIDSRSVHARARPWLAGTVATLAAVLGMALFTSAPAQADHEQDAIAHHIGRVAASHFLLAGDLFFGHAPTVAVRHYHEPRYERGHHHHARCGHGHAYRGHGKHHGKHDRHARKHHRGHHLVRHDAHDGRGHRRGRH
jgi:hypothetical protein